MREINTSFVKSEDELKDFIYLTPYNSKDGSYDINDHMVELNDTIRYIDDELKMLSKASDLMTWYDITFNDEEFKEKIKNLVDKKNELFIYRVNVKNLLSKKQEKCNHEEDNLRYTGHDHNYNYYECELCGKEIKD